jgi:hypothetical protein
MTAMDFDDPEVARAASEAHAALTSLLAPTQTVTRAGTMLRMMRQGLRDMQETGQDRILLGFLGVVVFGRSMTLVMQNLRRHDQDAFDSWYAPWRTEMKDDPLMRYFYDLRTKVIHHDAPAIDISARRTRRECAVDSLHYCRRLAAASASSWATPQ